MSVTWNGSGGAPLTDSPGQAVGPSRLLLGLPRMAVRPRTSRIRSGANGGGGQVFAHLLTSAVHATEAHVEASPVPTVERTNQGAFVARSPNAALPYDPVVLAAARVYNVDPSLVRAVIKAESGFDPAAVSHAGAKGLMQLMPGTAQSYGVTNPFDPVQNVFAGTAFLGSLLRRYGGNLTLALAAYNAGPGAVQKYGGVPPYPETQAYVREVLAFQKEMV